METVSKGKLLSYLNPVPDEPEEDSAEGTVRRRRVIDRPEFKQMRPFGEPAA